MEISGRSASSIHLVGGFWHSFVGHFGWAMRGALEYVVHLAIVEVTFRCETAAVFFGHQAVRRDSQIVVVVIGRWNGITLKDLLCVKDWFLDFR